jgi:hypothetical protein
MRRRLVLLSLVAICAPLWLAPVLAQKFWDGPSAKPVKRAVAELRIGHETALPGAIVQIKLFLTEPKPISTGLFDVAAEFGELAGVGVFSPSDDAYAVAWPTAGGIRLAAISTLSAFGLGQSDYPIVTLAVHVPATAPMGAILPVRIDPAAITLLSPNGNPYAVIVRDGSITVGTMPSVEDVVPGSAEVPAGGTITILGRDMAEGTRVQVDEAVTSQVSFVDPGRIEVTVSAPIVMHGREIKLRLRGAGVPRFRGHPGAGGFPRGRRRRPAGDRAAERPVGAGRSHAGTHQCPGHGRDQPAPSAGQSPRPRDGGGVRLALCRGL